MKLSSNQKAAAIIFVGVAIVFGLILYEALR